MGTTDAKLMPNTHFCMCPYFPGKFGLATQVPFCVHSPLTAAHITGALRRREMGIEGGETGECE
eukprot:5985605-Pyramimonas_sp.AAC.1